MNGSVNLDVQKYGKPCLCNQRCRTGLNSQAVIFFFPPTRLGEQFPMFKVSLKSNLVGRAFWLVVPLCLVIFLTSVSGKNPPTIGPEKGTLVIVGGGRIAPEIAQRFVSLAGGPDANIVVIPTAAPDAQINPAEIKLRFSVVFNSKNIVVLHTRDRQVADSKEFTDPLRHAGGVWIAGGRQWRLADAYLGTLTEREIKGVLARGGVVGGSSAGATIQGSYLVRGASATADNPDGDNTIMMAPGHEAGLGLLQNATIDQHLLTRHRENDLVAVIAAHPELLGIGIDEATAVVVHGGEFEVIGESKVGIYDGKEHDGKRYYFLSHGQKFDLMKRAVE
jgi:cyanophycinase